MQTAHGTQRTREGLIDLKPGREQDAAPTATADQAHAAAKWVEYLRESRAAELQELEQATAGLLNLLGHQYITPAADLIEPLVDLYELKGSKDPCMFYIHLFNYGYIEGKRAERARRAKKAATL